jgi:hypothetical protein
MDFRQLIDLVEKEDDEGKLKGFDSRTMQALVNVRAQYPNAPDDLSALLRHVTNVDRDSDDADEDHISRIRQLEDRVDYLEKMIWDKD